jgi:ATP-dependent helicase/nuclease subunit B
MTLELVVGPVRSGKLGVLLDRFAAACRAGARPLLLVPAAFERDALERDACRSAGAVLGGEVVTLDALVERVLGGEVAVASEALDRVVRRRIAQAQGPALGLRPLALASALERLARECDRAGAPAEALARGLGDEARLAPAYAAYEAALAATGRARRGRLVVQAAERLERELAAWNGAPVFAYGFDDLSAAQLRLLAALAGRCDVVLALPYEPGRPLLGSLGVAFEWLAGRAASVLESRAEAYGAPASVVALARGAFASRRGEAPAADGAVRLVEAAGSDGEARAVAAEVSRLLRGGLAADDVLVVAPDGYDCEPLAAALERAGVAVALDATERLTNLPAGHALRGLCRVAWAEGDRDDLFAWLRLGGSSWEASRAHDSEARLRARSIADAGRAERELLSAEPPRPVPELVALRSAGAPAAELRAVADAALARAYGGSPAPAQTRTGVAARRALAAASAVADELAAALPGADGDDVLAALDAVQVRLGDGLPRGRVRIVRLGVARLAPVRAVVLCGLENGVLPRRETTEAAGSADLRRALTPAGLPGDRPRQEERDRFLFAALLARVDEQLVLVRRASDDDSLELAPSPFWDEVVRVLGAAAPAIVTPAPHALDGHDERERLQAVAALARGDRDAALARAGAHGGRAVPRIERALAAWQRPTRLRDRAELERLAAQATYSVTELETFQTCSSLWFVERQLHPRDVEQPLDQRVAGSVMHNALRLFFGGVASELRVPRLRPEHLPAAFDLLDRSIDTAIATQAREDDDVAWEALRRELRRNLRTVVRTEADRLDEFIPRHFEISLPAGGVKVGGVPITGRIDRVDEREWVAEALIWDYKSGQVGALGANVLEKGRLQLPLYIRAASEVLGRDVVGGLYQSVKGDEAPRGLLREDVRDAGALEGFAGRDYVEPEVFEQLLVEAGERAAEFSGRMKVGDVLHDPPDGECPMWCRWHGVCRVASP